MEKWLLSRMPKVDRCVSVEYHLAGDNVRTSLIQMHIGPVSRKLLHLLFCSDLSQTISRWTNLNKMRDLSFYRGNVAPIRKLVLKDKIIIQVFVSVLRSVLSSTGTVKFRRTEPLFKPETWNVHNATITGAARTNNVCEGWNNGFRNLVGHKNPSLWTVIDCLQKDATMVQADILLYSMGQTLVTRKKKTTERHQIILKNLCLRYTRKEISLELFLEAVGDNIRIKK